MKFTYCNPVKVHFGDGSLDNLPDLVGNFRVLLVTTKGAARRGLVEAVSRMVNIAGIIDDVEPNPTFIYLHNKFAQISHREFDLIVALGGGSVLDSAKVLSVLPGDNSFQSLEALIKHSHSIDYSTKPVIAIPTTAGTGSEVTPWATVWNMENKKKYSLQLADLWPLSCICDPNLTMTMPWELTLSTGLDALSHSLEAIWNLNANPVSTDFAVAAARLIVDVLPGLKRSPDNILLREKIMLAALKAGLAFSNTKTAIAHAISYYVTANKGISHGIACSFTLPCILRVAMEQGEVARAAHQIFGENPAHRLSSFFADLAVPTSFAAYGISRDEFTNLWSSLNPARAGNSLVDSSKLYQAFLAELEK